VRQGRRGDSPPLARDRELLVSAIAVMHWTRFVGHLLVNAGDHAMAD